MVSYRNYLYEGVLYEGTITRKRIRCLTLRVDPRTNKLRVSAPLLTSDRAIDDFVGKHLGRLLKRMNAAKPAEDENGIYVLGKKENLLFHDEAERTKYFKKVGLAYLKDRLPYFEEMMGVKPPYRYSVKKMSSRYGSNSKKTHRLHFATMLFHYAPETVDSVIVHELAHHFRLDHSKKFYDIVYRYCPDYKKHHAKLRKHIYE